MYATGATETPPHRRISGPRPLVRPASIGHYDCRDAAMLRTAPEPTRGGLPASGIASGDDPSRGGGTADTADLKSDEKQISASIPSSRLRPSDSQLFRSLLVFMHTKAHSGRRVAVNLTVSTHQPELFATFTTRLAAIAQTGRRQL
jgi:hypothetical protein